MIHLTNDAVQKKGGGYGKYENGNKVHLNIIEINLRSRFRILLNTLRQNTQMRVRLFIMTFTHK